MKYIKQFNNETAYNTAKSGQDFSLPSVSLLKDNYEIRYDNIVPGPTPVDPTDYPYLIFTKTGEGTASIKYNYDDRPNLPLELELPDVVDLNDEELIVTSIVESNNAGAGFSNAPNASSVTSLKLPSNLISVAGFNGFSSVTQLTLPDTLTTLDGQACFANMGITELVIPDSLTTIADTGAFSVCRSLTKVTIGDGLTTVSNNMFAFCTSLSTINWGSSVTKINSSSFAGCTSLTEVSIPRTVTILEGAFYSCTGLETVYIPNSVITQNFPTFDGCTNAVVYCEAASKPAGWVSYWKGESVAQGGEGTVKQVLWGQTLPY